MLLLIIFFWGWGPPIKIQNDLHKTTENRLQQELDFGLGINTDLNSSIKGLHGFSTYFLMWPSDVEIVICRGKSRSGRCNPNMDKWRLCEKYTTKHYLFSFEDFIVETDTVNLCKTIWCIYATWPVKKNEKEKLFCSALGKHHLPPHKCLVWQLNGKN